MFLSRGELFFRVENYFNAFVITERTSKFVPWHSLYDVNHYLHHLLNLENFIFVICFSFFFCYTTQVVIYVMNLIINFTVATSKWFIGVSRIPATWAKSWAVSPSTNCIYYIRTVYILYIFFVFILICCFVIISVFEPNTFINTFLLD